MMTNFFVPEPGDFVELVLLYQSADIRVYHCLRFRKHRAVPNCVPRL